MTAASTDPPTETDADTPTASRRTPNGEHRALIVSIVGAIVFSALGVAIGVVSGSQVILFDGVFSLLGGGLAWLALGAARLTQADPTPRYPFGYEGYAPLVIGVEGIALLATCGYAGLEAVRSILSGGGEIVGGAGIVYAAISFVVPLAIAWWLGRTSSSELVAAEVTQWRAAGYFGLGMLVAFIVAKLLANAGATAAAGYVDPGLMLVAAAVFIVPPVRMLRTMLRELLAAAPSRELQRSVEDVVDAVSRTHALGDHHLRMTKVGPKLFVELTFVVDPDWRVADGDRVRHRLADELETALGDAGLVPWITAEFTADPEWGA